MRSVNNQNSPHYWLWTSTKQKRLFLQCTQSEYKKKTAGCLLVEPAALHKALPADSCSFKEGEMSSIHKMCLLSLSVDKICQLNLEVKELPRACFWNAILSLDGKRNWIECVGEFYLKLAWMRLLGYKTDLGFFELVQKLKYQGWILLCWWQNTQEYILFSHYIFITQAIKKIR